MGNGLIDDPVLDQILASGGFDSCLRSGCGGTSGGALAAFLVGRYFGLTEAGGAILGGYIEQARTAGKVLQSLGPDQPISLDAIPLIPGIGGPSIDGGRIAVIGHTTSFSDSGDVGAGFDYSAIFVNEPTIDELWSESENAMQAASVDSWTPEDRARFYSQPEIIVQIRGVYRSY